MNIKNLIRKIRSSNFYLTIKHSKNYFMSNIAVGVLGFISIPVMTRILSSSDYGTVNVIKGYLLIFLTVLTLNSYASISRYYYEDREDFNEFFSTIIIFVTSLVIIFFIIALIFNKIISNLLGLSQLVLILIIPIVLLNSFTSWYNQIFTAQRKSQKVAVTTVVQTYGKFAFAVIFILLLKNNKYLGQVYSEILIGMVFLVYFIFELRIYIKFSFKMSHLKYMFAYSLPLLPYSLSSILLAQFDRIMIYRYLGSSDAGLYSFAYNLGMILTLVLGSLDKGWMPDFFKFMNQKNYKKINEDVHKLFRILSSAAMALILFSMELGMILGKKSYHVSLPLVPVIIIGYIFYSVFAFYSWNITYFKKNIYLAVIVIISLAVNIILNLIYIPKYGYQAGAYTTAISYFIIAVLGWIVCKYLLKDYNLPFNIFIKPLMILAFFIVIFYVVRFYVKGLLPGIFLKILIFIVFNIILFFKYIMIFIRHKSIH